MQNELDTAECVNFSCKIAKQVYCFFLFKLKFCYSTLNFSCILQQVTKACKTHGGFYLGSIGGPAAVLAEHCIKKVEVLEYPELGNV